MSTCMLVHNTSNTSTSGNELILQGGPNGHVRFTFEQDGVRIVKSTLGFKTFLFMHDLAPMPATKGASDEESFYAWGTNPNDTHPMRFLLSVVEMEGNCEHAVAFPNGIEGLCAMLKRPPTPNVFCERYTRSAKSTKDKAAYNATVTTYFQHGGRFPTFAEHPIEALQVAMYFQTLYASAHPNTTDPKLVLFVTVVDFHATSVRDQVRVVACSCPVYSIPDVCGAGVCGAGVCGGRTDATHSADIYGGGEGDIYVDGEGDIYLDGSTYVDGEGDIYLDGSTYVDGEGDIYVDGSTYGDDEDHTYGSGIGDIDCIATIVRECIASTHTIDNCLPPPGGMVLELEQALGWSAM